jgi:hypothetical protein
LNLLISYSFAKNRSSVDTHPIDFQQGIAYEKHSPTSFGYPSKRKNKHVLNRQNSGLSASIPLPPIAKGN